MASGNTASLRHNSEKFRYFEGWKDRKIFDASSMDLPEQKDFYNIFGMMITMASNTRVPGCRSVDMYPSDPSQTRYFEKALGADNYDITIRQRVIKEADGMKKDIICIKNPALSYYFNNPLPKDVGSLGRRFISEGVLTGTALRTRSNYEMKGSLMWITANEALYNEVSPVINVLTKIPSIKANYFYCSRANRGKSDNARYYKKRYSMWFLKPGMLEEYLIKGDTFDGLAEYIGSLPDYMTPEGAWVAQTKHDNFMRRKDFELMKETHRLDSNRYNELQHYDKVMGEMLDKATDALAKLRPSADNDRMQREREIKKLDQLYYDVHAQLEKIRQKRVDRAERGRKIGRESVSKGMATDHARDSLR
jgi:hypothetical protein